MSVGKIYLWIRKHVFKFDDRTTYQRAIDNGMKVGKNPNFQDGVIYDPSHAWLISIGDNVTIAPRVHILCHDASTKLELGYTRIGKVQIGSNVFIGANSTILPGVTIGDHCVIGANSVVTHDIPDNSVAAGSPCRVIKSYKEYIEENRKWMQKRPCFDESYTIGKITEDKKCEMLEKLQSVTGFVK